MVKKSKSNSTSRVKVGSGRPKSAAKSSLFNGLNKWLLLAAFIVVFGAIGAYFIYTSNASSPYVQCTKLSSIRYSCSFWTTAKVVVPYSSGSKVTTKQVGTFPAGKHNIDCQQKGGTYTYPNSTYKNNMWGHTTASNGQNGWVNAVYGSGGSNYYGFAVGSTPVPSCSNKYGPAPGVALKSCRDIYGTVNYNYDICVTSSRNYDCVGPLFYVPALNMGTVVTYTDCFIAIAK